jgi:Flp pilus assembly protein TadG
VNLAARWRARDDRGVSALTVAVVFPVVMMLVMLAVQGGLYWHAHQRAEAAADRAAAVAARVDGSSAAGEAAAWAFLDGAPLDGATVSVRRGDDQAQATVTATAPSLVGVIRWTVTASSTVELERFVAEPDRQ